MKRFPVGLLAVIVMLALGNGIGSAVGGGSRPPAVRPASQVEVIGATAVCPDIRQAHNVLATRVSVGSGPLPVGRVSSGGKVEARQVDKPTDTLPVPVTTSGEVAVNLGLGTTKDGLQVNATGDLAAALEVEQITVGDAGAERGLAGLRCEPPKPDTWFEGGSTTLGNDTELILANVDDAEATVDISIFSKTGPVEAGRAEGITVEPHSRVQIPLDTLAPDRDLLALHIVARRGRVAAGLRHSSKNVRATQGVDWVPQTLPPSTKVVIPGFPTGPGSRIVYVTNPGTDDTTVNIQVTTQTGQYTPTDGRTDVDVPAGTTVAVHVDDVAETTALAATVTSDGAPVIAGGFVQDLQPDSPVREFAYTAGALPLSGPALITDVVINKPTESTLIMSAPVSNATVIVTPIQVLGQSKRLPAPRTVSIKGGTTATLRLSTFFRPGANVLMAVEVKPALGSGPVYAARYLREHGAHGPLTTLLVLEGPAQLVNRPTVVADPQIGTP